MRTTSFPQIFSIKGQWSLPWIFVAIASAAWAAFYVGQEDPAYLSDFQSYWKLYWTYGELFANSPRGWLAQVVASVHSSEYNPLFTVGLLPFHFLGGRTRTGYIEGVVLLYLLPAMVVAWCVIQRGLRRSEMELPRDVGLTILLMTVLYTPFWVPTLRGYPDVLGLVPLGIAVWWLYAADLSRPQRWTTLAGLALCIYAPFLIRKWYVFSIIAMLCAQGLVAAWRMWKEDAPGHQWGRWLFNHAVLGAMVLLCLVALQGRMVIHALSYSYADAYVAFQRTWPEHGRDLLSRHGWLVLVFSLSGWWLSVRRSQGLQWMFAYLWLSLALTVFLFTRIQGFGIHHHLPVGLFLLLLAGLSTGLWAHELRGRPAVRRAFLLVVCAIAAAGFFNVFCSSARLTTGSLLPEQRFAPLKLENPDAYRKLAYFLEHQVEPHQRVSIFASNAVLSQTMMENFLTDEAIRRIAPMAEVDEYEGFNLRPLYSDYLVAPSRVQVVDPQHQRVVALPSMALVEGRTIGAAFREVERIRVNVELDFIVFRKERPMKAEEVQAFLQPFAALPRPPGYEYTPMQMALLGAHLATNGPTAEPSARIDMVGGGEWALHLPAQADLTLHLGFWPDWLPAPALPGAGRPPSQAELIFSVQLPTDQMARCRAGAPHMEVRLGDRVLLSKTFDTPVVDYFKLPASEIPRLRIRVRAGADSGCDPILIDHRTD